MLVWSFEWGLVSVVKPMGFVIEYYIRIAASEKRGHLQKKNGLWNRLQKEKKTEGIKAIFLESNFQYVLLLVDMAVIK